MHKTEGAHLQCVNNHYTKFIASHEYFWSYRLHKLGTPKKLLRVRGTDELSGPITRPAFRQGDTGKNNYFSVVYLLSAVELSCSAKMSMK